MKKSSFLDLAINATLGDLELYRQSIDLDKKVVDALTMFRENPKIPGLLVFIDPTTVTMLSRSCLYAWMSLPYSQELYTKRTIRFLLENNQLTPPVVFSAELQISEATFKYLDMNTDSDYEPVIIKFFDNTFAILDIHHLLFAHACIHLKYVESLKLVSERKTEILGIVAHDLKNPLQAILGLSTLLYEQEQEPEEVAQMGLLLRHSSEHMLELITELLDSSVSELGMKKLIFTDISIAPLINGILAMNARLADKKNQKLIFQVDVNDIVIVQGDKVRIREAIDNVVNNAIKYSEFGAEIKVEIQQSVNEVCITIRDEGPGFSEQDLSTMFTKFQRLSAKPTNGESSTGLGLYIVKQIMDLHKAKIDIKNNARKGSCISLIFPKVSLQ